MHEAGEQRTRAGQRNAGYTFRKLLRLHSRAVEACFLFKTLVHEMVCRVFNTVICFGQPLGFRLSPSPVIPCRTRVDPPSYLGDAEVPELYDPRARKEDVLRLEVAVEDLAVMDVLQGQSRLHEPVVQSKSARGSCPGKKKRKT